MYHPSTRLLTILELLQARGRMSGPELAKRLEVSPRSVRRYVAMLQDMGIPVEGERGRYGQYRLRPGYKLPPLMFDDDEALAVTAGLLLIRRSGGLVEPATTERALAKLNRVLPGSLREQVTALQETLVLDIQPEQILPGGEQLAVLSQGVRARRRVWLRYLDERQSATERNFDPYGVVQRSGRWYATGYCHLRKALRVFRLDRINDVRLLEATFEPPEGFDAAAYVNQSVALIPMAHSAEVLLRTDLETARRELYPNFVILEVAPEGVIMRCTTDNLRWLARVIAGVSFSWEVREPPELEGALREHAANILAQLMN
ncbi:MAG: YafY family transcriptional regulator [Deinococcota bacterium]|jgi:predicted DNA-binding transcriptional regulator YafY|nr:YafY family transcriptional regulator [Deinococcota bacterium]